MTISIVLYGRNDNYGYNLHKRAALSLNCMAEVLTDPSDEIIFVDYNTPDDFPTFPEAIQDTLTKRARSILRILRVRPSIHERYKSKTHLAALEPVARNVAIRRSSPTNRWILSTNTDMIFVPRRVDSLSELARDLAPGFYHAPRIEIPEVLWESFDRHAPAEIITTTREWGSTLHLNEIVLGSKYILYDGPGDFQLLLRDDLFAHHGFHEGMLLGWHVDSNMARRMYNKYGTVSDLGKEVYGYHCDHTRQVTPAHRHTRLQNDWRVFCDQVDSLDIPEQANTWGCAEDAIEEVRLAADPASVYVQALRESVGSPLVEPRVVKYTHETYNEIDYDPRHVVPFLADMFVSMPKNSNLAWYGAGTEMLSRFAIVWNRLNFTGKILADCELIRQIDFPDAIEFGPTSEVLSAADLFVFDFGGLPGSPHDLGRNKKVSRELVQQFLQVVRDERRRLSLGLPGRRVVALNAINNSFELLVRGYVAAAATPCGTHMRHGYVLPAKPKDDWLPFLDVGQAGIRVAEDVIRADARNLGVIACGPYKHLESGYYRLAIGIEPSARDLETAVTEPCIAIEVRVGNEVPVVCLLRRSALTNPDTEFLFEVTPRAVIDAIEGVKTRIILLSRIALNIRSLIVESAPTRSVKTDAAVSVFLPPLASTIGDWLPYLSAGPSGCVDDTGIVAEIGPSGFVVYGPYWPVLAGYYEVIIDIDGLERENGARSSKDMIRADVITGNHQLVAANFRPDSLSSSATNAIRLPFEIDDVSSEQPQIETRVWSSGKERFRIRSLAVKALEQSQQRDLLPFVLIGAAGRRVDSGISSVEGQVGFVAYSPTIRLKAGSYRLSFAVAVGSIDGTQESNRSCAIVLVKYGSQIITAEEITSETRQVKQLLFEIPSNADPAAGLEFFLRIAKSANIILSMLSIEPTDMAAEQNPFAALSLRDWLPFLQTGANAHPIDDGVVVSEGTQGFAVYGPFWTLPPGYYEVIIDIDGLERENGARSSKDMIRADVITGNHQLVAANFRPDSLSSSATNAIRLPFEIDDVSSEQPQIETRVWSSGKERFRIRSLAVKALEQSQQRDLLPFVLIGAAGRRVDSGISSVEGQVGFVAYSPTIRLKAGSYRLSFAVAVGSIDGTQESNRSCAIVLVKYGSQIITAEEITSETRQVKQLLFEIPSNADPAAGLEFFLRIAKSANIILSMLSIEPTDMAAEQNPFAALSLRDWLPFLQTGANAHPIDDGVVVSEGTQGFAVYGPFWTLPPGRYEMRALILADPQNRDQIAGATGQVTSEYGRRLFAEGTWRVSRHKFASSAAPVEFRLPFTLGSDLPLAARTIETRIFTPGVASFRILSLSVMALNEGPKSNRGKASPSFWQLLSSVAARIGSRILPQWTRR